MVTPLGWFFIILMALFCAICLSIAWKASPPVDLRGILARAALSLHARLVPDYGRHSVVPGPVVAGELVAPLPASQVAALADAEQRASEPEPPIYRALARDDRYDWMAARQPAEHPYLTREEWQAIMQAGRPVEPEPTPDKPPWMITTNALDAVPATDQGTHDLYFGTDRCEADVLAAEAGAQMAAGYLP